MAKVSKYEPGQFSWIDLNAHDATAARRFYGELFGWETVDNPTDQGGVYTQFTSNGQMVAGMGEMGEDMKAAGVPAHWNSYVTVADVDASAKRAQELGAELRLPPMQVMAAGRMAILVDPTGAQLSLWQPGDHIGSELVNEPVSLCWNELATRDVYAAKDFYADLFGWKYEVTPGGQGPYNMILCNGRRNGGILPIGDDWPAEVPAHWTAYIAVEDCDATVAKLRELGGELRVGPIDIEPGRFASVADPSGAGFTVMKVHSPD